MAGEDTGAYNVTAHFHWIVYIELLMFTEVLCLSREIKWCYPERVHNIFHKFSLIICFFRLIVEIMAGNLYLCMI